MKEKLLILLTLLSTLFCHAQKNVKIFGTVHDAASGEVMPGASVYLTDFLSGSVTNANGYYSFSVQSTDNISLTVSYIGYKSQSVTLSLNKDTAINFKLVKGLELGEFEVSAYRYQQKVKQIGLAQLPLNEIIYNPTLMGEGNLISSLKSLPGVSPGKEGGSELFVRGGNYDQNLTLLDDAPIYNLNHAFGLLSVFNTSTIKNINLYKGGIPTEYGGRLSSVLEVNIREGHKKKYKGDISLSTFAGSLIFEGPIVKEKASFLISLRRSWIDQILMPVFSTPNQKFGLHFYDINTKVNFTLSKKHKFFYSLYLGKDEFNAKLSEPDSKYTKDQGWSNQLHSLRYNTILNNGAFAQITSYYTKFNEFDYSENNDKNGLTGLYSQSNLHEYGIKGKIKWILNRRYSLNTGLEFHWRQIEPPNKRNHINETDTHINLHNNEEQLDYAAFTSLIYSYGNWNAEFGIRASVFVSEHQIFKYIEPRVSTSFQINPITKLKAGIMKNAQPLYAMRKQNNGFPSYAWIPLTKGLRPQESLQASLGATFTGNTWMLDVETYYKKLSHLANNYRYPYDIYSSENWFSIIDQGEGYSYGIEFSSSYKQTSWDLRLSYTLSKAESKYQDVNNNEWFPFDFDVRHEASLVGSKNIYNRGGKRKWFSFNFAVNSGLPATIATNTIPSETSIFNNEQYYFDFTKLDLYNSPNNGRFPIYHRLDIGFHMKKKIRTGERTWSIGALNVYNRQNPYIYYRSADSNIKQLTLFPFLPFISFKRSF